MKMTLKKTLILSDDFDDYGGSGYDDYARRIYIRNTGNWKDLLI